MRPRAKETGVFVQTKISFREAFRYWLKLGFVNFGGPAGQIAMMHRDMSQETFITEKEIHHERGNGDGGKVDGGVGEDIPKSRGERFP